MWNVLGGKVRGQLHGFAQGTIGKLRLAGDLFGRFARGALGVSEIDPVVRVRGARMNMRAPVTAAAPPAKIPIYATE